MGWVSHANQPLTAGPGFMEDNFPPTEEGNGSGMARARSLHCALHSYRISFTSSGTRSWSWGTPASRPEPDTESSGARSSTPQPTPPTVSPSLPPSEGQKHPHPQRPSSGALACPRVAPGLRALTLTFSAGRSGFCGRLLPSPRGSPGQRPCAARQGPAHSRTGGWRECVVSVPTAAAAALEALDMKEGPWTQEGPWTRREAPWIQEGPWTRRRVS